MNLPGVCQGCRASVVWNGKVWRDPGQYGRRHQCPKGTVCGAFMPVYRDRCARSKGHSHDHRSRYAMDNAVIRRRRSPGGPVRPRVRALP